MTTRATVQISAYVPDSIAELVDQARRITKESRSHYLHRLLINSLRNDGWLEYDETEPSTIEWKVPLFKTTV